MYPWRKLNLLARCWRPESLPTTLTARRSGLKPFEGMTPSPELTLFPLRHNDPYSCVDVPCEYLRPRNRGTFTPMSASLSCQPPHRRRLAHAPFSVLLPLTPILFCQRSAGLGLPPILGASSCSLALKVVRVRVVLEWQADSRTPLVLEITHLYKNGL